MITTDSKQPLAYPLDYRAETASLADLDKKLRVNMEPILAEPTDYLGAVLFGGVGAGKTYAMAAAYRAARDRSIRSDRTKPPFWCVWPFVLTDIEEYKARRKQYAGDPTLERFNPMTFLAEYRGALFVDDVGAEHDHWGDAASIFAELVMQRVLRREQFWITTNLTVDKCTERYGERAISRLAQHCLFIAVSGGDRRVEA